MLTTESWLLKTYIEENFVPGKYFTVEEICENVRYSNGEQVFKITTSEKCHAKCIKLWQTVRDVNYDCEQGQKIIIKNKQGSIKLAENVDEFNEWKNHELAKVEKQYKYLNNLTWKAKRDGTIPILNQALNENKDNKSFECYMHPLFALVDMKVEKVSVIECDDVSLNKDKRLATIIGGRLNGHTYYCDSVRKVNNFDDAKIKDYLLEDLR